MDSNPQSQDIESLAKALKSKVHNLLRVYGLVILGTIVLFILAVAVSILLGWGMYEVGVLSSRLILLPIALILLAGICVGFVINPLIRIFKKQKNNGKEIKREDYPDLFSLIDEVVEKVDCLHPKHVYLSDECNAYVNYPSLRGYISQGPQNLTIGIPLLFGMNKTEMKSILSHEFGHFTQKSVAINGIANLSEYVCAAIAHAQEVAENAADDTLIAKARGFAEIATKIMVKQYHKVAPLNGELSRAQEYDADRYSYIVAGTDGSLSALCKIQELSSRWDNLYMRWLWHQVDERLKPKDVRALFEQFSARIDRITYAQLNAAEHFRPSLAEFDSRISPIENTDTHPSTNQRCKAIASYPKIETSWDNTPAYSYFPDTTIVEMFDHAAESLKERRFPGTSTQLFPTDLDAELLPWADDLTAPILDFFFKEDIFYHEETINAVGSNPKNIPFPFTKDNANRLREFYQARDDYRTLHQIMNDNSPSLRFLYDGKEYNGTNVPIDEQRAYSSKLYDIAQQIAVQSTRWMLEHVRDNDNLGQCLKDMFWFKQDEMVLRSWRSNMEEVYSHRHDKATKYVDFANRMETDFRDFISKYFSVSEDGGETMFERMCHNVDIPEENIKESVLFMQKEHRSDDEEFYNTFCSVGSVLDQHHLYNWDILKKYVIMPVFLKEKDK